MICHELNEILQLDSDFFLNNTHTHIKSLCAGDVWNKNLHLNEIENCLINGCWAFFFCKTFFFASCCNFFDGNKEIIKPSRINCTHTLNVYSSSNESNNNRYIHSFWMKLSVFHTVHMHLLSNRFRFSTCAWRAHFSYGVCVCFISFDVVL